MLVVLLGMGALVIDVGALYQERRELQNGADAAALGVAKDCATVEPECSSHLATAHAYADANASDGVADIADIADDGVCGMDSGDYLPDCQKDPPTVEELRGATGYVKVSTLTKTGEGDQVKYVLAPLLSAANVGGTMHAAAVAAWGPPSQVNTIPLTFSECEFRVAGGKVNPTEIPTGEHFIYFHGSDEAEDVSAECEEIGPAGQDAPGGFGWLNPDGACTATVEDGSIQADTGNDFNSDCEARLKDAVDKNTDGEDDNDVVMVIPIFEKVEEQGANTTYTIVGFTGFKVTGYKLGGQGGGTGATYPNGFKCPEGPGSKSRCIRGEFSAAVIEGGGGFGNVDFGAVIVEMVG